MGQLGVNLIELIQPVSGTTPYSQHLAQKGPGLHHLGFSATDLATGCSPDLNVAPPSWRLHAGWKPALPFLGLNLVVQCSGSRHAADRRPNAANPRGAPGLENEDRSAGGPPWAPP
jgi:hypothetical protein